MVILHGTSKLAVFGTIETCARLERCMPEAGVVCLVFVDFASKLHILAE